MTTNTCKNKNCGCKDTGLTTPAPCSCDVVTCPPPAACPETFNDCCIIHTGDPIVNLNIQTGDSLCVILQKIAIYTTIDDACVAEDNLCRSVVNFQITNITTTGASLYWNAIVNPLAAITYKVEYSTNNTPWTSAGIYSNNIANVTGLTANTKYYIRVITGCDAVYGCESVTLSFTTKPLIV